MKIVVDINDKEFELHGVNADIYTWMVSSDLMQMYHNEISEFNNLVLMSLSSTRDTCVITSLELTKKIWGVYPEIGAPPITEHLADDEYNREFYSNYRDHITHMLKVFFLGCYIYEKNSIVNKSIKDFMEENLDSFNDSDFLKIWTIAALFHDIGYVFENENKKLWGDTCTVLNNILSSPLSKCNFFSKELSETTERRIINNNKIFTRTISNTYELDNNAVFDSIENRFIEYSYKSKLSSNKEVNGIKKYCELALKIKPEGRERYRDHGISSSLLFYLLWTSYVEYVKAIEEIGVKGLVTDSIHKKVVKTSREVDVIDKHVELAVAAIALHNISSDNWDSSEAINFDLTLDEFCLNLANCNGNDLPFAFLLRLSDELQLWDRPKFKRPESLDRSIEGGDFRLSVSTDNIFITFKNDVERYINPTDEPNSFFNILFDNLTKYLDKSTISMLVKFHEYPDEDEVLTLETYKTQSVKLDRSKKHSGIELEGEKENSAAYKNWIVGAMNFDEDLHFSSYYLFQSMADQLPDELHEYGYNEIIAVYEDFNEIYYLKEEECRKVSNKVIEDILKNPLFFDKLLKEIESNIENLQDVFDLSFESKKPFKNCSDDELANYYLSHNKRHQELYKYARVPETLDRGVNTFTNYLKDYLREKSDELQDDAILNKVFETLTFPENISIAGIEIIELYDLLKVIKEDKEEAKKFKGNDRKTLIKLSPNLIEQIEEYADSWKFWGYHGYGNRAMRDISFFIDKFKVEMKSDSITSQRNKLVDALVSATNKRLLAFAKYKIDETHQLLFKYYSRIGTIKMLRRYYQLRNFSFLDKLIAEIALRYGVSESVIRCMTCNEVEELLKGNKIKLENGKVREKSNIIVMLLKNKDVKILEGVEAQRVSNEMRKVVTQNYNSDNKLYGLAASTGKAEGIARIVTRKNGISNSSFNKEDIFVSADSDPDLFEIMKNASAVLTESGGLTCHAAIVCRELKIPSIVGVRGLLDIVEEGDYLSVDAYTGQITITKSDFSRILQSTKEYNHSITKQMGNKAFGLFRLIEEEFRVPDFFCIPYSTIKPILSIPSLEEETDEEHSLWYEVKDAIDLMKSPLLAIRSSSPNEDNTDVSGAGQEITELRVVKTDVSQTTKNIILALQEDINNYDNGSIIVQNMILGDYSGVVFTSNPLSDNNELIIEAVPGGNEYLTSGKVSPVRYIINKKDRTIREETNGTWRNLLDSEIIMRIFNQATRIEKIFGSPQDIEWTYYKNDLYILQTRNITGEILIDKNKINKKSAIRPQNILSVYRTYALPISLQNHMLRVTAVASWIIERWNGPELDVSDIIETLLIHDIGNIVKAENEKFPMLFPDTYEVESFNYWLNIRKWIVSRYGDTDVKATYSIAKEIGVSDRILEILSKKQFANNSATYSEKDWDVKICAYADQRVSPHGVLSLNERLNEAIVRYRGVKNVSVNRDDRDELVMYAGRIEKQLFEYIDGNPEDIHDKSINTYIDYLKEYEFDKSEETYNRRLIK